MQKSMTRTVTRSALALVASLACLTPRPSSAAWEKMTGTLCQPADPGAHDYTTASNGAWLFNRTTSSFRLTCPIPDTEDMPQESIGGVYFDGYDGCDDTNCRVGGRVCALADNGEAGGCGQWSYNSNTTGAFSKGVADISALQFPGMAYLYASLPKTDGSFSSGYAGLYFENSASLSSGAFYQRMSGIVCQPTSPSVTHAYVVGSSSAYAGYNSNPFWELSFVCPVPDRSKLPKANINQLSVTVYDGNNDANRPVIARACSFNSATATGGTCGVASSTNSSSTYTGHTTLNPGIGPLSSGTAYLWITLPASDTGVSRIKGLYFAKP